MSGPRLLVLGDTGLAGVALVQAARARGLVVRGASRHGEIRLDLRDAAAVAAVLDAARADLIINAAALVSVAACERDPGEAWRVNARPVALIADHARRSGARLAQISTDHFYCGDGRRAHREDEPVTLLNDYARSKYAAEAMATTCPGALVARTNIIGLNSATGGSFGEWARALIETDGEGVLFDDQFVSTLDVWTFAEALLDLLAAGAAGVVNVAAREVFSKAELVAALAHAMGRPLTRAKTGSVAGQTVQRPDSLGLDVTRAEAILDRRLPTLREVAAAFAAHAQPARSEPHALG